MSEATPDNSNARRRLIQHRLPRCPTCGSTKLRAYRTTPNGDNTTTQHSRCKICKQRLFILNF